MFSPYQRISLERENQNQRINLDYHLFQDLCLSRIPLDTLSKNIIIIAYLLLLQYYFIDYINEIEDVYLIKSELERKMSDLCFEYKTTNLDKRLKSFIN